jgi:arylamine N-acetyltransferase
VQDLDVRGYLRRLGVDRVGTASVEDLVALHIAHVQRIPYTSLDIHLGRRTTVDPLESADRVVRTGRAGYCFHNNGAFAALLTSLGYDARWHVAAVQRSTDARPPGREANHLGLTVHGLPSEEADGVWIADVGLGDALLEPVPLRPGTHRQGPLDLTVQPSSVAPAGWRLQHDALGTFTGVDFWPEPAGPEDFVESHQHLSTSPTSGFVRTLVVARPTERTTEVLKSCTLRIVGPDRAVTETEVTGRTDWFDTVTDRLGLPLDDVSARERDELWRRVRATHQAWLRDRPA